MRYWGRGRHAALAEEWKLAGEAGVELAELRLDCLRREPDLKRILAARPTPFVFTVRRGADGGLWRGPEEKRQRLMREAIVAGVDFIDIEMDIAREIRRFGKTKRIISYHNLKGTPPDLLEIAQQAEEMDADIVKIATKGEFDRRRHAGAQGRLADGDADHRDRHGLGRLVHPGPGGQIWRPVHVRQLQPRPELRRRDAPVPGVEGRLPLRLDRQGDRDLRRHRRPDRPQPQPGHVHNAGFRKPSARTR